MNMKEIIVMVGIALTATFAINYFFMGKRPVEDTHIKAGQGFVAPLSGQIVKPLRLEVDFLTNEHKPAPVITELATSYATLLFSSEGAILEKLTFKEHVQTRPALMSTIVPSDTKERTEGAFLVALQEFTPYYYQLIDKKETEFTHELTYITSFDRGVIEKKFTIAKQIHKIDLTVTITPKSGVKDLEPRILYPSPYMPEIAKYDVISAVVSNEQGTVKKIAKAKLDAHQGWFAPTLFGTENKYFIHSLVQDSGKFVQRAYYKVICNDAISILEGPVVSQSASWTLSFYMGPKSEEAIAQVDKRLEDTIEYSGILAPIARVLLAILIFLNGYLHNYGLAIIALTLLIKLVLWPFTLRGTKDLKKRADYQKKLAYIQQKYKHDPEQLKHERDELVRKHGMPGLAGCLPLLLQLPIFLALQKILSSSIELYQAPFLWIPDLSAADPYYILPLFVTIAMFANTLWAEPSQRLSMLAMGLVLGAFAVNFAAGLALYLVVNTLLQSAQTAFTGKVA